jgi:hypothetical protein
MNIYIRNFLVSFFYLFSPQLILSDQISHKAITEDLSLLKASYYRSLVTIASLKS